MTTDLCPGPVLRTITHACGHTSSCGARATVKDLRRWARCLCPSCGWERIKAERLEEQAMIANRDAVAVG